MNPESLPQVGVLWTWTVQRFPPKSPYIGDVATFQPYAVGYIDLDGEVLVESRIVCDDPDGLFIGMAMRLCTEPLATDGNGDTILTYAFRPAAA
jgi:uncharacterized OB-fold protein